MKVTMTVPICRLQIWPVSPTEGKGGYRLVLGTLRSGALSSSSPLCSS